MEPRRRFRFLKALSEGSFGKVYLAEMVTGENFSTVVAIKLLHGKWLGHEEIVMRSRDEARLLGLLRHQNIIRVEDLSSINGQCAVIMEYLEGVDLKTMGTYLAERGELFPRRAALEITAGIASALDAAYNHRPLQGGKPLRVIHRDIKPSNVMITAAGEVKVLDFGTARANFEDREAKTQALAFGSQAYMAPERMMGDPDTPAADVFSLGVTLWEIISGDRFGKIYIREGRYQTTLEQRVAQLDFAMLDAELAERVRELMRQMMDYDATARPTSAEVVERMEELAEQATDMGLRRLCRQHVLDAMATRDPGEVADDPLTGTTLVEDRSSAFVRPAGQHTWSDESAEDLGSSASLAPAPGAPSEASSGSWLQDAAVEPLDDTPAPEPSEPGPAARESSPSRPSVREPPAREPAAVSPVSEPTPAAVGAPEAPPEYKDGDTLVPPVDLAEPPAPGSFSSFDIPPDLEAPSDTHAEAPGPPPLSEETASDPVHGSAATTWDGEPVVIGGPVVTPPSTPVTNERVVEPVAEPVVEPSPEVRAKPTPVSPPAPAPKATATPGPTPAPKPTASPRPGPVEAEPGPRSSGIGKLGLLFAGVGLLGVLAVGGGAVAWVAYGRLQGPGGQEHPDGNPVEVPVTGPEHQPGHDPVALPPTPVTSDHVGSVVLRIVPGGGGEVSIINSTFRFKETWDGQGDRTLAKIPVGTYRTKIDTADGSLRSTFEVVEDKTCTYTFEIAAGAEEWRSEGCI